MSGAESETLTDTRGEDRQEAGAWHCLIVWQFDLDHKRNGPQMRAVRSWDVVNSTRFRFPSILVSPWRGRCHVA